MAEGPIDRRVRRTRRRLKEALMGLLAEKRYDDITVRELCARADVGRSTFYGHFDSKEDLLFAGFDEWLFEVIETPGHGSAVGHPAADSDRRSPGSRAGDPEPEEGPGRGGHAPASSCPPDARFRFSLPLLEHIRTRRRFFRATIVGGASSRVRRRTHDLIAELARRELLREGAPPGEGPGVSRRAAEEEERLEARAHAVAGAFLALASWWMENPRRLSAGSVDEVLRASVLPPGS